MWNIPRGLYVILIIPIIASIGLLTTGVLTSPEVLTDEGYSLKSIFFITGAAFFFFPLASAAGITAYYKHINNRTINLIQNGIRGIAEILSREQTGIYINDLPQIKFSLKITLQDGKTYAAEHKDIVNLLDLGSVEVGARLPVFIDPDNEKNMLLIYDDL